MLLVFCLHLVNDLFAFVDSDPLASWLELVIEDVDFGDALLAPQECSFVIFLRTKAAHGNIFLRRNFRLWCSLVSSLPGVGGFEGDVEVWIFCSFLDQITKFVFQAVEDYIQEAILITQMLIALPILQAIVFQTWLLTSESFH